MTQYSLCSSIQNLRGGGVWLKSRWTGPTGHRGSCADASNWFEKQPITHNICNICWHAGIYCKQWPLHRLANVLHVGGPQWCGVKGDGGRVRRTKGEAVRHCVPVRWRMDGRRTVAGWRVVYTRATVIECRWPTNCNTAATAATHDDTVPTAVVKCDVQVLRFCDVGWLVYSTLRHVVARCLPALRFQFGVN